MDYEAIIKDMRWEANFVRESLCNNCLARYTNAPIACALDNGAKAIEELLSTQHPDNPPLNLEEMKALEGEPVWVEVDNGIVHKSFWAIVGKTSVKGFTTDLYFTLYGCHWVAYRYKRQGGKTDD